MKLSFYFPYHQISGVPVLFANLINTVLSDSLIEKIYIIDYEDGALNKLTEDSPKLKRLYFNDGVKLEVPKDSILVMQSLIPYTIRDELVIKDSVKIFFWNLHPENLVPNFVPIISVNNIITANYKFFKKYIDLIFNKRITNARNFLELCLNKKSLVFMDKTNLYNTCYKLNFSQDKKINFLPVPVNIKNRIFKKKIKKIYQSPGLEELKDLNIIFYHLFYFKYQNNY